MSSIARKKNTGEPGNPGQFGSRSRSEADTSLMSSPDPAGMVPSDRFQAANDDTAAPEVLERLAFDSPEVQESVAAHPNTPSATLDRLASHPHYGVRQSVAGNSSAAAETLDRLADDRDGSVRIMVAHNPSTSAETLSRIARTEKDEMTIVGVALNEHSDPETLTDLASHPDLDVQAAAVRNPSTPATVLNGQAAHPESYVRAGVAANPSTPVAAIEKLAADDDWTVRRRVIRNTSVPEDTLRDLAENDPVETVRQDALAFLVRR